MDILKLYETLHWANLDTQLPIFKSLKIEQPITLRQLLAFDRDELARMAAPCLASLRYCAPLSADPLTQRGQNFAEMTVDSTCLGIVLSEAMPSQFMKCLNRHLHRHTPPPEDRITLLATAVRPPDFPFIHLNPCMMQYRLHHVLSHLVTRTPLLRSSNVNVARISFNGCAAVYCRDRASPLGRCHGTMGAIVSKVAITRSNCTGISPWHSSFTLF